MYYFAYGSNMDLRQMDDRCKTEYDLLGLGLLEGWEFFINTRHVASVICDDESNVYGLLFKITEKCLNCLDRREGYFQTPKKYDRDMLQIRYKDGIIQAWVYIDKNCIQVGTPRPGYLERIIEVANKFDFPKGYINHLESFLETKKN